MMQVLARQSLVSLKTTDKQTKRTTKVSFTEICAENMKNYFFSIYNHF